MNFLPAGPRGLMVEVGPEDVVRVYRSIECAAIRGVVQVVPAARTILVEFAPEVTDHRSLASRLRTLPTHDEQESNRRVVSLKARYDGPDLATAAELLSITTDEVVRRHLDEEWSVAFTGFVPGFAYLLGTKHDWQLPRRDSPRTSVPAGSVAIAGGYCGVYPRSMPGGWHLIGVTEAELFDIEADPPSLLTPGTTVEFVAVDA